MPPFSVSSSQPSPPVSSEKIIISYDREVNKLYIRFKETTVTTTHLEDGIDLIYDAANLLAGIDNLAAAQRLDNPEDYETTHRQRS